MTDTTQWRRFRSGSMLDVGPLYTVPIECHLHLMGDLLKPSESSPIVNINILSIKVRTITYRA